MMRSMFAGVSGLRSHQTRMDVIGNNIANVNTVGYKASRVTFQDIFSETLKGASAPDSSTGMGGTNPMQIGLGMGLASVDILTTRGSLQSTENLTDLAIEGDGFFIVKGGEADTFKFTRAGDFKVDKQGNLVTSAGLNVYGWHDYDTSNGQYEFDTDKAIEPINLYEDDYNKNKRIIAPSATENIELSGNLDASLEAGTGQFIVPIFVYDSLGNEYKINIQFTKNAPTGTPPTTTWDWTIPSPIQDSDGNDLLALTDNSGTITFDGNGNLLDDPSNITEYEVTFTPDAANVGAEEFKAKIDFSKITMYTGESSVESTFTDGYASGSLVTISIGADGIISGVYSNGRQQPLGMIGLAAFDNPAGLQRAGNNLFLPTTNSGDFQRALKAGSQGVGTLNPGTLEMSNVDLAEQFTDMIVTQRGFQANSRIMTAADEMLQEIANMKR